MTTLGIFARYPERGKTKTRLAATIGNTAAAELYAAFVRDLIERCGPLADELCVAVTPESDETRHWFGPLLPSNAMLEFQPDGDLGERIAWFFERAGTREQETGNSGQGRAVSGAWQPRVLIGSDSPDLPTSLIAEAFAALEQHDVVLGPATDGGFVLVGVNGSPGVLFDSVRWSQPTTLLDVLDAAAQLSRSVVLLQPWYDIDTAENLGTLRALQRLGVTGRLEPAQCPHTVAVLAGLSL